MSGGRMVFIMLFAVFLFTGSLLIAAGVQEEPVNEINVGFALLNALAYVAIAVGDAIIAAINRKR